MVSNQPCYIIRNWFFGKDASLNLAFRRRRSWLELDKAEALLTVLQTLNPKPTTPDLSAEKARRSSVSGEVDVILIGAGVMSATAPWPWNRRGAQDPLNPVLGNLRVVESKFQMPTAKRLGYKAWPKDGLSIIAIVLFLAFLFS